MKNAVSTRVTRRTALAAGLWAGSISGLSSVGQSFTGKDAEGLAAVAQRKSRFFGCAVQIDQLNAEADLRSAVLGQCSHITPEVELKWAAIEPTSGQLQFDKIDDLTAFATRNKKIVRGHTLLWNRSVPAWAAEKLRDTGDWEILARYFGSVIPRYGDVIRQWDVINEPIETGYREDGLRRSVFLDVFGPEYINRALTQARVFAPTAQLLINEYGLEYGGTEESDRRYLFLKLLDRLKRSNAPLDGIGIQAHLDLRKGYISESDIANFLHEVRDMGLSITVTELDVKESDYAAPRETRDRLVAQEVRRYLDVVLSGPRVLGVTTWGLSDRHSWLEVTGSDYARFPGMWTHGDGPGLNRGLPLDAAMQPKPLYFAIRDALANS